MTFEQGAGTQQRTGTQQGHGLDAVTVENA